MLEQKTIKNWSRGVPIVSLIWLLGVICDRIWFNLDHTTPAWDQADYLNGAMNYWHALQSPEWFNSQWWQDFWQLSSKIPPLFYITTSLFLNLFGTSFDAASLVLSLFSAILLIAVYSLGLLIFDAEVGLWAALLCQVAPGLYRYRLEFLLDYPVTAVIIGSFCLLTLWRINSHQLSVIRYPCDSVQPSLLRGKIRAFLDKYIWQYRESWLFALAFGISLGIALMIKQTSLLFLLVPILWLLVVNLRQKNWLNLTQLLFALYSSTWVFGAWYSTNWLFILTSGKRATVDSAIAEGDPPLYTVDAWLYYLKILPYLLSWVLLLIPIACFLIYLLKKFRLLPNKVVSRKACPERSRRDAKLALSVVEGTQREEVDDTEKIVSNSPSLQNDITQFTFKKYLTPNSQPQTPNPKLPTPNSNYVWLAVFLVAGYLLCSLNVNKDARYILPLLPIIILIFTKFLFNIRNRWQWYLRTATISLALLLMVFNIFPVGGSGLTNLLSPRVEHYPYLGAIYPNQEVIAKIVETEPYLTNTLAVLPSTPEINQHNFSYYGARADFQVYGRQVGVRERQMMQDARSLDWFLLKTGDQDSISEKEAKMSQIIRENSEFQQLKAWELPDNTKLELYHRQQPAIAVTPITDKQQNAQVTLKQIELPSAVPPGVPVPVIYTWSGSWEQLQSGLVLLTWHQQGQSNPVARNLQQSWLHDHGIAMNRLHSSHISDNKAIFQIKEKMAMLPHAALNPGIYTLEATYLNRNTGETYPISLPPIKLEIDFNAAIPIAPELDLITQLRTLAGGLAQGQAGLEPIFEETARINQYDPIQDYLTQAEQTLSYHLEHGLQWNQEFQPSLAQTVEKVKWCYGIALARALQRDVKGTISALKQLILLDDQNPYNYAYLAFVYLYNFQPGAANQTLNTALNFSPNLPELHALKAIASLMQGNILGAWHHLSVISNQ